jgi:putative transposase
MRVQVAPPDGRLYDGPMSHPKCRDTDYIDFLIATPRAASCCEAARNGPPARDPPAHDAYSRLLTRLEPNPEVLYREVEPLIDRGRGVLVIDDSTLDKFHAKAIEPVHRHWSGKHKAVVRGINLISSVWTDGDRILPADCRIYDKPVDGLTENDHFRDLIAAAERRGFRPRAVLFDSWYSGLDDLKLVRSRGWAFLTRLKCNRKVDLDRQGYRPVSAPEIPEGGVVVHLEGFGPIRVFKAVSRDGDVRVAAQ